MHNHTPKYLGVQKDPYGKDVILGNCTECGTTLDIDFFTCGHCGYDREESLLSGYGKDGEPVCFICVTRMKY